MPGKQRGRVTIVTGGTANLGKLFAGALAEDGADTVVHYNSDRPADAAAATVAELKAMGVDVDTHQGDLTAAAEITRLVDHTVERFGHWDILVNTAGLIIRNALADTTEDEYDRSMAINAKIPYFLMREAATKIARQGPDRQPRDDAGGGDRGHVFAYAGSKAPVEHFTKAFAKEIGGRGVTVNCIAPGPQKTQFFFDAQTPETVAWLSGMTISGELGDPMDVVPVVRFLAASETRWVTAQTIYVNGGMISPVN